MDISAGGFSCFLPVALRAGEKVGFMLRLSSGEMRGRARVVNVSDEGTAYRIAFALEGAS